MAEFFTINQCAHLFAGMLGVFGPIALFGRQSRHKALVGILCLGACKEFILEYGIQHAQKFWGVGGAAEDFLFFGIGAAGAYFLYHLSQTEHWT